MSRKHVILAGLFVLITFMIGCDQQTEGYKPQVTIPEYTRAQFEMVFPQVGDLTPELKMDVVAKQYKKVVYRPLYNDMEIDHVNVSLGDHVKKGDVLISFKSEEIEKQKKQYEEQKKEDQLLLAHYQNMAARDATKDYTADIEMIQDQLAVDTLYVEELTQKLSSYSIRAEEDGTVFNMMKGLELSTVSPSNALITMIYGNDIYTGETSDPFPFEIGKDYEAVHGATVLHLTLTDMEPKEPGQMRTLTFRVAQGESAGTKDVLQLRVSQETLKNVLHIPTDMLLEMDGTYYVYVMGEDGYRTICEVQIGEQIGNQTVILSGLNEDSVIVRRN